MKNICIHINWRACQIECEHWLTCLHWHHDTSEIHFNIIHSDLFFYEVKDDNWGWKNCFRNVDCISWGLSHFFHCDSNTCESGSWICDQLNNRICLVCSIIGDNFWEIICHVLDIYLWQIFEFPVRWSDEKFHFYSLNKIIKLLEWWDYHWSHSCFIPSDFPSNIYVKISFNSLSVLL